VHTLVCIVTWHVMFVHLCTNHCYIRECMQLSWGANRKRCWTTLIAVAVNLIIDIHFSIVLFPCHGVTTITGTVIVRFFFLYDADLLGMVSSLTSALAAVSHGHSRLSIQVPLVAIDRTSVKTSVNRTTSSTTHNSNQTSITVSF